MDYLVFRLYGPMAAWGEIAVGESRHSARYPGKSAIIGLMAAALGIRRDAAAEQERMQNGYSVAVEVHSSGTLLSDFHTAQVPRSVGKQVYRTRRDEVVLGRKRLGTILSSREYRCEALALAAVKMLPEAPHDLEEIRKNLLRPRFHLYLGRKSCPLAAPLHPVIVREENFYAAFRAYPHKGLLPFNDDSGGLSRRDVYWLGLDGDRHYYWEGEVADLGHEVDLAMTQTRVRHDQPLSRERWQFLPRQEHYLFCPGGD